MDYKEILSIALSPWTDVHGIMQLAKCGKNTASRIRTDIEKQVVDSGKRLPTDNKKYVPTRLVLEYLGLDEEYIIKMASLSK